MEELLSETTDCTVLYCFSTDFKDYIHPVSARALRLNSLRISPHRFNVSKLHRNCRWHGQSFLHLAQCAFTLSVLHICQFSFNKVKKEFPFRFNHLF